MCEQFFIASGLTDFHHLHYLNHLRHLMIEIHSFWHIESFGQFKNPQIDLSRKNIIINPVRFGSIASREITHDQNRCNDYINTFITLDMIEKPKIKFYPSCSSLKKIITTYNNYICTTCITRICRN